MRGGRVVDPGCDLDAVTDLLVRDGRIAAIGQNLTAPDGATVVDATGLVVDRGSTSTVTSTPSPDNTDIALAMAGAGRGYRVILTIPASMSKERHVLLKAFGAELVLTDPTKGTSGAIEVTRQIVEETPGAVWVRQFKNAANPQIHRETTAQEILRDTDGNVDVFVAEVGTAAPGRRSRRPSPECE